jgi:putative Holliday junction resolvase
MSRPVRTVLAFDFGLRQIGVAVGNCLLGTTQPLETLPARDGTPDWNTIARLIEEWQPDLLIVGDPVNMDGSPSELSGRAARFARRLQGRSGVPFELCDERLSSFEAKQAAREDGHRGNYRRHPVDSLAAELILKTWLVERGG